MFSSILKLFIGNHHRRFLRKCAPVVKRINSIELEYQNLTDDQLRAKTAEFKARHAAGESLDTLLPEAFAVVKNAARRLCGTTAVVCEHELTWEMVHFDVQLVGGMALHQNKIAEMATGEGKTLVATLPLYLNALTGRNCQLVTVNDYLARRDSEWMGHLYRWLGLTVGCIQNQMPSEDRKAAYACDITYGTASEFGFDYLRDNGMALSADEQVQRDHYFCIVDEIDSILVDEARTPLIISGPVAEEREPAFPRLRQPVANLVELQIRLVTRLITEARDELDKLTEDKQPSADALDKLWLAANGMPRNRLFLRLMENGRWRKLLEKHEGVLASEIEKDRRFHLKERLYFAVSERNHESDLSQLGRDTLRPGEPDAFVLPDLPTRYVELDRDESLTPERRAELRTEAETAYALVSEDIHAIGQLLKAYTLYEKDKQYVVHEGKVKIVDENTGRIMEGRRWSDGLHQAVEAKEGVALEKENKTYATVTIQNYFRMYQKLSGMTGTAETEASEFHDIYRLTVVAIPTHRPCIRVDDNDIVFKTRKEKYQFAIKEVTEANKRGQPVLVGTASVEASETLSRLLTMAKVPHKVLNAKHHESEADIVSMAGQFGAVTIATNMAGRGTDIKLGEGVRELGGLYVLATERHEVRRVDRQLRGRCSRQGDPGLTKFYLSLEDDLMRLFLQGNLASKLMEGSMQEGEELEHPWLNRSIESAQKKVEQQNYSQRKRLLQYDDVLNQQREVIYGIRNGAIHSDRPKDIIFEQIEEELMSRLESAGFGEKFGATQTALESLVVWLNSHFPISAVLADVKGDNPEAISAKLLQRIKDAYAIKESVEIPEALGSLERYVVINAIDHHWQEHLTEMEDLRKSIGLRSYGQKDPLVEYKGEAYKYFEELMTNVRLQICTGLFRSASNLASFENMLSLLSRTARAVGPADAPVAPPPAAPRFETSTTVTSSGPADAPAPEQEIVLPKVTIRREVPKVGRNEPCPCGSGKKFKKCHGEGQ